MAFQSSPYPMMLLKNDEEFTIEKVSLKFLEGIHAEEKQIIGKGVFEVFPEFIRHGEKERNEMLVSLRRAISTGQPDTMPVIHFFPATTKSLRYFQCTNTPLSDGNDKTGHLLFTAQEVTQRVYADLELRKARYRMLSAQKLVKIGYSEYDLEKKETFWSDEIYHILGLDKNLTEPDNDFLLKHVHPDDRLQYCSALEKAMAGEQELRIEVRIVVNGNEKWIQQRGALKKNRMGKPMYFEYVVKDITVAKQLKLAVQESNLRYFYLSKAVFNATYDWDVVNHCYAWGDGFLENFGYDDEAFRDNNFWLDRVHPEDIDRVKQTNKRALEGTQNNSVTEYRFKKSDGSYAHIIDRTYIVRDSFGKPLKMIGAIQDETKKRSLEMLLDKTNRLAKIGSWQVDVERKKLFWSDVVKEIREVPQRYKPTVQVALESFIHEKGTKSITTRLQEAIEKGIAWNADYQMRTHKGNLKWVRIIGEPEFVDGKCVTIYGSLQDIDDKKRAELEAAKILQEKNSILESIGDGFFRLEKDWTVTYWNREAEGFVDMPREEVIGRNLWDIFQESVDSTSYHEYHRALETGKRTEFEDFHPTSNKWFSIKAYPYENGLSVFFNDISDKKLAEEKLKESQERYSRLFQMNPLPIWLTEAESLRFVEVNRAAIEKYGYSEEEFRNMNLLDIRPAEDISTVKEKIRSRPKSVEFATGRYRHVTKSGKTLIVVVQSTMIEISGSIFRLSIITDITERVEADIRLTRAIIKTQENERYELGAELHDNVCQILASTYISMGVLAPSINENVIELFKQCREYVHLATKEIRNLSHRLAPASLSDANLEEAMENLINNSNIENKFNASFYFDKRIKKVEISKELQLNLYRILQEQLRNVVKYARCKNVDVELILFRDRITMRIADDGVGFETEKVKGGIGLSNMKRRAELFEGTFEITSSPGNGSELIVNIPWKQANVPLATKSQR